MSEPNMSKSLNCLQGCYTGLYKGLLLGLLRRMLGVKTTAQVQRKPFWPLIVEAAW